MGNQEKKHKIVQKKWTSGKKNRKPVPVPVVPVPVTGTATSGAG